MAMEQIIQNNVKHSKISKTSLSTLGIPNDRPLPRYMMFSGHDTNIGNLWTYLEPIEFKQDNFYGKYVDWFQIPYASSIQIELH